LFERDLIHEPAVLILEQRAELEEETDILIECDAI
jgi:hypothetical protein